MKGFRMNKQQIVSRAAVASSFFLLLAAPALSRTQDRPFTPAQLPHKNVHAARPRKQATIDEYLPTVNLTDDQKAKIDAIRRDMKSRMDVVATDTASSGSQKEAMIAGLKRMENRQIAQVLTVEQREEIRTKILASRAAEQQSKKLPATSPD
jgi:Spy/CpxP family protein refolding chaperone